MFEERVGALLKWKDNDQTRRKYLSPYLVVIQSSGMGKTKLLYEYKKMLEKEDALRGRFADEDSSGSG
jgi:hypothetical protein